MSSQSNTQNHVKSPDMPLSAPTARVRKYSEYDSDEDSVSANPNTDWAGPKKQKTDASPHGLDGSSDLTPQDLTQLLKQEREEFGFDTGDKAGRMYLPNSPDRESYAPSVASPYTSASSAASSHTVGRPRIPSSGFGVAVYGDGREDWPLTTDVDDSCNSCSSCSSRSSGSSDSSCSSGSSDRSDCSDCSDRSKSSDDNDGSDTTDDNDDSQDDGDSETDSENDNGDINNAGLYDSSSEDDDDSEDEVDLLTEAYRNAIDENRQQQR
jgi:hypothetical protein